MKTDFKKIEGLETTRILKAEIIFCLAYYGNGMNPTQLYESCEAMKYSLALIKMLDNGEVDYDNKKRVYTLTEKGRKAADKIYNTDNKNKKALGVV